MKDISNMPTLTLGELRRERGLTQVELAAKMDTTQSNTVKMEKRPNPTTETLQRYIEALGGKMTIVAVFGDSQYAISTSET